MVKTPTEFDGDERTNPVARKRSRLLLVALWLGFVPSVLWLTAGSTCIPEGAVKVEKGAVEVKAELDAKIEAAVKAALVDNSKTTKVEGGGSVWNIALGDVGWGAGAFGMVGAAVSSIRGKRRKNERDYLMQSIDRGEAQIRKQIAETAGVFPYPDLVESIAKSTKRAVAEFQSGAAGRIHALVAKEKAKCKASKR